jgi:hypothetical protein
MEFKIYGQNFSDGVLIVGSQEVENPMWDGKAYPCIEVRKNTAEIMETKLIAKDDEYWADAFLFNTGGTYNFIVHELGGKNKIVEMLKKIIAK